MAIRTTQDAVIAVLTPGEDYDGKSDLAPYIESVSPLVDWLHTNYARYNRTALTTAQEERVECWLAAWAYKMSDQQEQSIGQGASASFKGQSEMGLQANNYGQTACLLDTSRMLKALDEGRIASTVWLGKVPSQSIPYEQRN